MWHVFQSEKLESPDTIKKKWFTLPKVIVFIVICLAISGIVYFFSPRGRIKINEKNFPDPLFRDYVREFDKNNDGYLSSEEREKPYWITVNDMKIEDLTGIEYFAKITSLDCTNCEIKTLDVSQNKKLRYIDCPNNNIEELVLPDYSAEDESELIHLDCSLNYISDLDLSQYKTLEWLDCSYNELSTLNLHSNTVLSSLDCSHNGIRELDLASNTNLES